MKKLIFLTLGLFISTSTYTQSVCNTTDIFDDDNRLTNQVCFEVDDNIRYIFSNNYPDHSDNYNQAQFDINDEGQDYDYSYTMCAYPEEAASFTPLYEEVEVTMGCTDTYEFGVSINGVRYDPSSAVTFENDDGSNNLDWHVEATSTENSIGQNMGTDNGGHLNPFGEYHYHGVPTDYFVNDLGIDGSDHSPIVGYAADGFPIYYKYVFSDETDDLSSIETASSGYTLRSGTRGGDDLTAPSGNYDGNYYEDYEYSAASTILDECNGRTGVTPDYPYGTYYYVITDEYPYIPRCFKGTVLDNTFRVGPTASCTTTMNQTQDDCSGVVEGCMDPFSDNYNASANLDDGSCTYSSATWTGTWDNTDGPDAGNRAVISSDYTFSTDGVFECNALRVNTGFTLTVDGNKTLIINGNITNNGTIVVESGSALINYSDNTFSGNSITYKRNTRYSDGKYSFVGSPVEQSSSMIESDLGSTVYSYAENVAWGANDGESRWVNNPTSELIPGKGYAQAFQQEIVFSGIPNNGTITYSGTYTEDTNDDYEGWNLVANPYMAAIDVHDFIAENDNTTGALYLWDDNGSDSERGDNSDYVVVNSLTYTQNSTNASGYRYNEHIGASQGFFVKLVDNTDLDIDFTEEMRVSGSNEDDAFFRVGNEDYARINLTNNDGLFKQTVIAWRVDANDELNRLYDASLFDQDAFGIHTVKQNRKLAIQAFPEFSDKVSLGVNIASDGEYTISLGNDFNDRPLYLVDLETGISTNLAMDSYSFASIAGNHSDRFIIQNTSSPLSTTIPDEGSWNAFFKNGELHIKGLESEASSIFKLMSLSGQLIFNNKMASGDAQIAIGSLNRGIYLLTDGTKTIKIYYD
jgi:hypothetical protein